MQCLTLNQLAASCFEVCVDFMSEWSPLHFSSSHFGMGSSVTLKVQAFSKLVSSYKWKKWKEKAELKVTSNLHGMGDITDPG